ncbi:MAG: hypothetical protein ACREJ6_15375 [Candidatus Methylomirabilis sp.]
MAEDEQGGAVCVRAEDGPCALEQKEGKMKGGPVSDHDWTIHSLNIHGIFFQRWCQRTIEDSKGWKVKSVNYPVEFNGRESNLDIRAELRLHDGILTLLVECKKNNPDFIDWIFFPKYQHPTNLINVPRMTNMRRQAPPYGWEVDSGLQMLQANLPIADEARETRGQYGKYREHNKTKTSNAAIQESAYQIALAAQAIWKEEHLSSSALGKAAEGPSMPWKGQIFFPTVVTSARMFTCEFDPNAVDPVRGEIPYASAKIVECPYLYYEYALPRHLQFPPDDLIYTLTTRGSIETLVRKQIFIVHSEKLTEFLSLLASQAEILF